MKLEDRKLSEFTKYMNRAMFFVCLSLFLSGFVFGFLCGYYIPNEDRLNSVSSKLESREGTTPLNLGTTTVQPSFASFYRLSQAD